MTAELLITQGPYSRFLERAAHVEGCVGLRLNTVMPVPRTHYRDRLRSMRQACGRLSLWVDLKARQLRVESFANVPYTAVTSTRRIQCTLPTTVYFDNGRSTARLVAIEEQRLILESNAGRLIGPGESINIPDSSLVFLDADVLTDTDLAWIDACRAVDNHHYMLSFTESADDIKRVRQIDPDAVIMAKIESRKGLERLDEILEEADCVMAARGDLYVEMAPPHHVDRAVRLIVERAGPKAVVGSRMLESLLLNPVPSLADLSDLHRIRDMGVQTLLIGDDLCFDEDLLFRGIRIVQAIWKMERPDDVDRSEDHSTDTPPCFSSDC